MPRELSTYINDFIRPINVDAKHKYNAVIYELINIADRAYSIMVRVYIVDVPPNTILDMDYYEELHIPKNHTDKDKKYMSIFMLRIWWEHLSYLEPKR